MRRRLFLALLAVALSVGLAGFISRRRAAPDPIVASVAVGGLFADAALDPDAHLFYSAIVPAAYSGGMGKVLTLSALNGRVRGVAGAQLPVALLLDAPDRRLFSVDAADQRVRVLNTADGRTLASVPVAGLIDALALDRAGGRLFVLHTLRYEEGSPVYLSMLRVRTGALLETRSVAFDAAGSSGMNNGLLAEGRVGRAFLFDADGGMLYTVDVATGRVREGRYLQRASSVALQDVGQHLFLAVGASPPSLSLFDAVSGRPVRLLPLPAGTTALVGTPVVAAGRLFAIAAGGIRYAPGPRTVQVVCFDVASGVQVWRRALRGGGTPSLDTAGGHLFVLDAQDGLVQTIDAARGRLMRVVQLAHPGDAAIDHGRHRLYVASGTLPSPGGAPGDGGAVAVFDTRTGAMVSRTAVGMEPQRLLLDARAHRLLVVGETAPRTRRDPLAWLPEVLRRLPGLGRPSAIPGAPAGRLIVLDTTRF